jgi:hypothetical protein
MEKYKFVTSDHAFFATSALLQGFAVRFDKDGLITASYKKGEENIRMLLTPYIYEFSKEEKDYRIIVFDRGCFCFDKPLGKSTFANMTETL